MTTPLGQPLEGGYLPRLNPSASPQEQATVINGIIDRLNDQLKTQVLSDGQVKRWLYGYQKGGWPGGDFGMKISFPNIDVTVATAAQLLFSWDFTKGTQYWYNPADTKNFMQLGVLPNGKGGAHIAKPGFNVADAF